MFRYVIDKWLSPTQGNQQLYVELPEGKSSPSPIGEKKRVKIQFYNRKFLALPMYLINIKTADVMQNQTTENIEMIIRGSDGQISRILLKDYVKSNSNQLFQKGNLDQFEIEHHNIGTVNFSSYQSRRLSSYFE